MQGRIRKVFTNWINAEHGVLKNREELGNLPRREKSEMSPSSCKPEATNPASARPACQKPEGQLVLPARWRSGRLRGHLNRRANIPRSELRQNSFSKTVP